VKPHGHVIASQPPNRCKIGRGIGHEADNKTLGATSMAVPTTPNAERLLSLDVFRGIVILLLIPDTIGGLSFYVMAERHPDDAVWRVLASVFSHSRWSGTTVWDLIMPAFAFIAGVSMAYSYGSRRARGESEAWIFTHAALRSAALLALHVTLSIPVRTGVDYLWPLAILALGAQLPKRLADAFPVWKPLGSDRAELCWWLAVLALVASRAALRFNEIPNFELFGLLPSLGLAYFTAYLLISNSPRLQAAAAFGILFLYWLAFVLHEPSSAGINPTLYGITAADEVYSGYMSHWSKGTHVAAAVDVWLLNLFPRHFPYTPPIHGTHTLRFIPLTATLLFGVIFGRALRSGKMREKTFRNHACVVAILGIVLALLLGQGVEPIVMRIWTSSWTLYSTGLTLLLFVGLHSLIGERQGEKWISVFVVAGSNSLLLYTLALGYRWPVIALWLRVFGASVFDGYWQPVAESLAFALSLWILAFVLYRFRFFLRL
jgi:predicted acyltransferase